MKNFIRYFGFYILLCAALVIFYFSNFHPLAFYFILLGLLLVSIRLEKYIPFNKNWLAYKKDLHQDMFYGIASIFVNPLGKTFAVYILLFVGDDTFSIQHSINKINSLNQLIIGFLVAGFLPYWYHRLSHTSSIILWKIHSIHHSPNKLYWLNGLRLHPINTILNTTLSLFPLLMLGISNEIILIIGLTNTIVSGLNHTNIDFRLGVFNYLFNMSEIHRWHHAENLKEGNSNYSAGAFVFCDIIFQSFYFPRKKIGPLGLTKFSQLTFPYSSLRYQLCYPICSNKSTK